MGDNKYQSILRVRNALLLLAVGLAAGVALTGWMAFSAPQDDPGTEESGPPAGLSAEPFAEPPTGLPGGDPSTDPPGDPSAEASAPGTEESEPPADPSAQPSMEFPGGLTTDPSGDSSAEASAQDGEEDPETGESGLPIFPSAGPSFSGIGSDEDPLESNSAPVNSTEVAP